MFLIILENFNGKYMLNLKHISIWRISGNCETSNPGILEENIGILFYRMLSVYYNVFVKSIGQPGDLRCLCTVWPSINMAIIRLTTQLARRAED